EQVFSTACEHTVPQQSADIWHFPCHQCNSLLANKNFKNAIWWPMLKDEKFIYINHHYRDLILAELYAKSIGLKEIITTSDAKNTPCICYAQGVLQGKYSDFFVFTGLVEAMVQEIDCLSIGKGMQNFRYPPA
ncbi:hypothetical protein BDQ17DRAFT_1255415, partial [Cyathus striatus]